MDQLICASLSHTRYWYEVGMLKVPADTAVELSVLLFIEKSEVTRGVGKTRIPPAGTQTWAHQHFS